MPIGIVFADDVVSFGFRCREASQCCFKQVGKL